MKKREVAFLNYSLGEELISAISHGIGTLLAIAACVLCAVKSAIKGDAFSIVGGCIFGASLIILYCVSTLYHSFKHNKAKQVFRVIDHCSVFLLIAGTYTPYLLVSIRGVTGWVMFGIIWGLAAIGIVFNSIDVDKYQVVSAIVNLLMGWSILFAYQKLLQSIGGKGMMLLLLGGAAYTVGALLYAIGTKVKYMHSIFHLFVVAGSILHFFSIYLYVL